MNAVRPIRKRVVPWLKQNVQFVRVVRSKINALRSARAML